VLFFQGGKPKIYFAYLKNWDLIRLLFLSVKIIKKGESASE